jgi:hypothetical protein
MMKEIVCQGLHVPSNALIHFLSMSDHLPLSHLRLLTNLNPLNNSVHVRSFNGFCGVPFRLSKFQGLRTFSISHDAIDEIAADLTPLNSLAVRAVSHSQLITRRLIIRNDRGASASGSTSRSASRFSRHRCASFRTIAVFPAVARAAERACFRSKRARCGVATATVPQFHPARGLRRAADQRAHVRRHWLLGDERTRVRAPTSRRTSEPVRTHVIVKKSIRRSFSLVKCSAALNGISMN